MDLCSPTCFLNDAVCVSGDRDGIRAARPTALINIGFFAIAPERPLWNCRRIGPHKRASRKLAN